MRLSNSSRLSSSSTLSSSSSKSKINNQKRKEVTLAQIIIIIVAILIGLFLQNQEAILNKFSQITSNNILPTSENNDENNYFGIFYKSQTTQTKQDQQNQEVKKSQDSNGQNDGIRPLFKKLLDDRIEKLFNKQKEKIIINETPKQNWTKVTIDDISMNSIRDIIQQQKTKNAMKGSQFYHGQMSFIVSLKASANFIQNSLFLEHTMIEQIGKGRQISKIIDTTFQYVLKSTIGFEGISKFVNSQRGIRQQIHGIAALKSASKTIRTQFTVDLIYTMVETGIDLTRVLQGTITGKTFAKNIFVNVVSTTGSTIGFTYGTIKFGNTLGGIMGSISGAFSSNFLAQVVYNFMFSDEPVINENEVLEIFKQAMYAQVANTDLSMNEIELLISKVQGSDAFKIDSTFEEDIFRQKIQQQILLFIDQIIANRDKIVTL